MVRAIERTGPFVVDRVEAATWTLLLEGADQDGDAATGALESLRGTPHAQTLASGLVAMARAPGLARTLRPFHRHSRASAFFTRRARRIGAALGMVAAEPEAVARYTAELRETKVRQRSPRSTDKTPASARSTDKGYPA
jgi:hypothetical protein|eukprot:COSAG01_NODE_1518_length_10043_cov_99.027951_3_plen_139_part_00